MMKLEKRILDLELGEEKASLSYPTVLQHKDYAAKVNKSKNDPSKVIDHGLDLLVSLGLPKEWTDKLEHGHLQAIMQELFNSPK